MNDNDNDNDNEPIWRFSFRDQSGHVVYYRNTERPIYGINGRGSTLEEAESRARKVLAGLSDLPEIELVVQGDPKPLNESAKAISAKSTP